MNFKKRGFLLILSAPSGTGKTTITRALLERMDNLFLSRSTTTRPPRPGEVDGEDYDFVSNRVFKEKLGKGTFLEHADIFGNFYGTPLVPVQKAINAGKNILFDIDWQGAKQIQKKMPDDAVSIFLLPPSVEILKKRLLSRNQDSIEEISKRLKAAIRELDAWENYDYVLVNDCLEKTIEQVEEILRAEALKQKRAIDIVELVDNLKQNLRVSE